MTVDIELPKMLRKEQKNKVKELHELFKSEQYDKSKEYKNKK